MGKSRKPRKPKIWEALFSLIGIIVIMAIGIVVFKVEPHIPMFIGIILAALIALKLGYRWGEVETMMIDGITQAMQSILILIIVGMMVGVWLVSGTIPTMIYYGMKLLNPSYFLITAVIVCSITALATGTSWGTVGTMGIALMGIAKGLGVPPEPAAGAIISGAYFGDKLSPLSETTNLAPAVTGVDVYSHVKYMLRGTIIAYLIALIFYGVYGAKFGGVQNIETSNIEVIISGIKNNFYISPILLIPPMIVIVTIFLKVPSIPGITLGLLSAAFLAIMFQDVNFGEVCTIAKDGFVCKTGVEAVDNLLTHGGLMQMASSILMTIIAMMFGGIMEKTRQLEVLIDKLVVFMRTGPLTVLATEVTCIVSNIAMPEQYISILVPGRMFAPIYKKKGIDPRTLSNALESSGTVSSALIPWNTCGMYMGGILGVSSILYGKWAVFNWIMPIVTLLLAFGGYNITYLKNKSATQPQSATQDQSTMQEQSTTQDQSAMQD